jgi:hypothetical protein
MGKQTLIQKIDALPPHLQQEVLDYADFLAQKYISRKRKGKFKFKWAGALSELKSQFTSVELQHKSMEWR